MQEELTGIYYCCTIYFFFAAVGGWWSDDDGRCGMTDNVARSREIKRADCTVDVLDPEFAVQRDRSIDRSEGLIGSLQLCWMKPSTRRGRRCSGYEVVGLSY